MDSAWDLPCQNARGLRGQTIRWEWKIFSFLWLHCSIQYQVNVLLKFDDACLYNSMDGDFFKFFFVIIYFKRLHYLYISHDNTQFRVHYLHPCIQWMKIIQTKFSYRKKARISTSETLFMLKSFEREVTMKHMLTYLSLLLNLCWNRGANTH